MNNTLMAALLLAAPIAYAEEPTMITLNRAGAQPSQVGPEQYFTGRVRIDSPFQAAAPARVGGASVTFEPGARTAWHTHPLGQTLLVTAGAGWVQQWGEPVQQIRPGDVVWIPAGTKHWHGASASTGMSHVAIAEAQDGKVVDWLEQVSDAQYPAAAGQHETP
jgi:quercetin dioxygenase-like cupin family protein